MRTLTDDDTGEKFEFNGTFIPSGVEMGTIKPIKKKFDWSQVADGVFVRDGTYTSLYKQDMFDRGHGTLDTKHWQYWGGGGGCGPLPDGVLVDVRYRDDSLDGGFARELDWSHSNQSRDIIAYKVRTLLDNGWEY